MAHKRSYQEMQTTLAALEKECAEHQRVEDLLRESESKLSAITGTATDAILLIDNEARISYWNRAAERIFGYSVSEAVGRPMHHLIVPEELHEQFERGFRSFRETGKGRAVGKTLTFKAVRKGGALFSIEVSTSAFKVHGQWHAAGIIRDISSRRKMEEELFTGKKLESLGILAGGLAHDFNNLLTAILGNIEIARLHAQGCPEAARFLSQGELVSLRAKDLIHELITFSEGFSLIKTQASAVALLEESAALVLVGFPCECRLSVEKDLWPVCCDTNQVKHALGNILVNAAESMPGGGVINARLSNRVIANREERPALTLAEGRYVGICIEDHGVGISEQRLPMIFDPYFSTKARGSQKGMGLGLAVAFSIVRKHGGSIAVDSKVALGTKVNVYLPALEERGAVFH